QAGHLHPLLARARGAGRGRGGGGRSRSGGRGFRRGLGGVGGGQGVALEDAAILARALDGPGVQIVLGDDALHRGRQVRGLATLVGHLGAAGVGGRRRGGGAFAHGDLADHLTGGDGRALFGGDLGQHAVGGRRDL